MKFRYKGFDVGGTAVFNTIEAASVIEATEALRRQGIFATEVVDADRASGLSKRKRVPRLGVRLKNLAMFTRQLQVLVATGTPLAQALSALQRQATSASWGEVVADLRSRVEAGAALSSAMAEHPAYFDSICRSLIAAGESAGNLPAMLDRLAVLVRKQLQVRRSIVGAAIYPALLVVVAAAVLVVLLTFVLPRFAELFKSLDTPLPPTTQFLMSLSAGLRNYWWLLLALAIPLAGCAMAWLKTESGRRTIDSLVLRLPQFGAIVKSFATARLTRILGILLQGHVPLIEALQLTRGACSNHHYSDLVGGALEAVTRGDSLAVALSDERLIAPSVREAIVSGERSGQLAPLLTTLADFMDESNEVTVRALTSILEPLILVVLGVLVGFVAVSLFLPLFDLTAATGGG
ncbi:MAG TPA: type II secretion system F family protein [Tepidisphaeraceae bacterium]|nr:type II secretion system F family protein [Tepidisphaeraceae bacterium]